MAKLPPSISGENGHKSLFKAALAVVKGFGIDDDDDALDLLQEFNERCIPPWSEKELLHKIEGAKEADADDGYLLDGWGGESDAREPEEPSAEETAAREQRAKEERERQKLVSYAKAVKPTVPSICIPTTRPMMNPPRLTSFPKWIASA